MDKQKFPIQSKPSNRAVVRGETFRLSLFDDFQKSFREIINRKLFASIFAKMPLAIIIVISLILRVIAAGQSQGFVHPDEVFQTVEMVHYRIFGKYGSGQTIPWEYRLSSEYGGARSWFFVFVLAVVYRFVMALGISDPFLLIFSARLFLSLTSIITVFVAYFFGKEAFNEKVGLINAFLCGTWWFFPFWASRTMTDSPASDFLFLSTFLLYKAIKNREKNKESVFLAFSAGAMLGIAFMMRFPSALLGIPLLIFALIPAIKELRGYFNERKNSPVNLRELIPPLSNAISFCIGSFLLVVVQGFLDLFTWGSFLHSPINFFMYNVVEGYSSRHGTAPWYSYIAGFFTEFGHYFLILFIIFFAIGVYFSRKKPKTLGLILALIFYWIVIFSLIAHKEFRFIMAILPIGMTLVATGISKLASSLKQRSFRYLTLTLILATFVTSSVVVGVYQKNFMWTFNSGICNAMYWTGQQEDVERVIVFENVWYTGGYSYLHKNISCDFIKINILDPPEASFNSSYCRMLYRYKGTYVIVRGYELWMVVGTLESFNLTFQAEVYGNPSAYVFAQESSF
ncbi:MAG: hypothetical protein GF308_12815 [Candidatus Heimdallarchaeota archaeon]|nr:hypothetical protein [Candidatus Heimdallarchaeota archaeon]